MEATKLLKTHHKEVALLLTELQDEDLEASERDEKIDELGRKLLSHMIIEQVLLYPQLKSEEEEMVHEGYEEHRVARVALERVLEGTPEQKLFQAQVKTLQELIQHHVKEEESDLFSKAKKQFSSDELDELGDALEEAFTKLVDKTPKALLKQAEQFADFDDVEKQAERPRRAQASSPKAAASNTNGNAAKNNGQNGGVRKSTGTRAKSARPSARGGARRET